MPEPIRRRRTRPARIQTPVIRVRLGAVEGHLVNISATGALVRAARPHKIDTEWPLVFDLEARQVELTARIRRCQSVAVKLTGATLQRREYLLGVMFTRTPAEAMQAVTDLCGGVLALEEVPLHVLVIGKDAELNESVSRTVGEAGDIVRTISDGRMAVDTARELQPDAVIIALRSDDDLSDWWFAVEAMAADPATLNIPVIVVAPAAVIGPERLRYLAERRAHVLPLPLQRQALLTLLGRVAGTPG